MAGLTTWGNEAPGYQGTRAMFMWLTDGTEW